MHSFIKIKFLLYYLITGCVIVSCQTAHAPRTAAQLYDKGLEEYYRGFYTQAAETFQRVITENPGTKLATFAYLKKADSFFANGRSKFNEAEMNYKIFLNYSPNSHLIPYVLFRLIALNFKQNEHWFFGNYIDTSRDPEPFKKVIAEYQRFYLLYPQNQYLKATQKYFNQSVEALASHEFQIGTWYFDHKIYPSAISRYIYLLKNYPNYSQTQKAAKALINAYKKNQQPQMAAELIRIYENKYPSSTSTIIN